MEVGRKIRRRGLDRRQWVKLSAIGGLGLSSTRATSSAIGSHRSARDLGPPPSKPFAAAPLDRVHIEGRSPEHHWETASDYLEEFDHPLWKTLGRDSEGASPRRDGLY